MIHKYKLNGYNIVIDVNSGSIHEFSDVAFAVINYYKKIPLSEMLELYPQFTKKEILEALIEIDDLKEMGLLFAEETSQAVKDAVDARQPVVKALCLHIAHDCNLKCTYCFAEEGEYKGKRSLMSLEVGKSAIDFLIANSGSRRNLEVDFFGGEPLMNFEVVKEIVRYGREVEKAANKNFRFTLTTNGVLLNDDITNFANEHMHNIVLSIDGRKETNDLMRKKAGGQGTYDDIVPKFIKLANQRNQTNYYVRGTYTKENMDFSNDVLHLASLGFKQISVEPVAADSKESYAFSMDDLPTLFAEYEKLAAEMVRIHNTPEDFNFFHFMIDLTGGPCVIKRLTGCGAACEYLAVTPEGDLYPCHQFVGIDEFKMGDLKTGVVNLDKHKEFESSNVFSKDECADCFAKFYCSGGCAANGYFENGDINKPFDFACQLQRKRVECAIMIKVATNE